MNEIEELGLGTIGVAAISGIEISEELLKKAEPKFIISQLFKKVNIPEGYGWIKVPKVPTAALTVEVNLSEGSTISESSYSYNANTVSARKMGLYIPINNESLEYSAKPLLDELLDEVSTALAKAQELRAMTIALDIRSTLVTEADIDASGTTLATTNVPVLQVISSTFNTGTLDAIDYSDGKFRISDSITTGTVTFLYSNMAKNSGQYKSVAGIGTLTVKDILNLAGDLAKNSLSPDVVLINDQDIPDVLYDASGSAIFLHERAYTDKSNFLSGEIGMLAHLKLLSSALIPQGIAIVADSKRLGYNCIREQFRTHIEEEPGYDQTRLRVYTENDFVNADSLSVGLLCNFGSLASDL